MINLYKRETEILNGLKDFQRATVERVYELFQKGQNRVLVADEVGLGKTLIAKGVIAKTAILHKNQGDDLFKVIYICSNQNIARQNVMKLKIDTEVTVGNTNDTRLSMQHLKFHEEKMNPKIIENYVQLIPLTPATSFNMTGGSGIVQERALIYAIFKRLPMLAPYDKQLEEILRNGANSSWEGWAKSWMEQRVKECNEKSNGDYLKNMISKVEGTLNNEFKDLKQGLLTALKTISSNGGTAENAYNLIYRMRQMMAQISIDFLEPDLVIMDEFQRFRELISEREDTEIGMLTKRFLYSGKVKTLLLSATPYKLYSTLEEIDENGGTDDHYNEFMQVIDFLFDQNDVKRRELRIDWQDFSNSLKHLDSENWEDACVKKKKAEDMMFEGICRTERLMVSKSGNAMLDTSKARDNAEITANDILSYIEGDKVTEALQELGSKVVPPVEYVKSSPYIFSFMDHYKIKEELRKHFNKNTELARVVKKSSSGWLKRDMINNYKKLPPSNARLERLLKETFEGNPEFFMWVPPSLPYYEPEGAYKNSRNFSKILVFSAWEMVPRMIASLVSYESERRTIGKLVERGDKDGNGIIKYFVMDNKRRYPRGRLNLSMRRDEKTGKQEPGRMALFTLMYPCITLAKLFNPIELLNSREDKRISRSTLEKMLRQRVTPLVDEAIAKFQVKKTGAADERWYWAAPIIFDYLHERDNVRLWLDGSGMGNFEEEKEVEGYEAQEGKEENNLLTEHFKLLKDSFLYPMDLKLGLMPEDLIDILVLQTIGAPGVCLQRMFLQDVVDNYTNGYAMEGAMLIAKNIVKKFNLPESTAIVDLLYSSEYSRKKDKQPDEYHWINVMKYCADGNFQAVLDEYRHMLVESYGLWDMDKEKRTQEVATLISQALKTYTASYKVDTVNNFLSKKSDMRMRSHFAAGFYNPGKEGKVAQRTESLRQSFNSPFRPFVLATTSIGQEGLDFHYYCRKIMHWNLPSNPIDLEQREGRINRYKGLAIRQNAAIKYGNIKFKKDIWNEMFETCKANEKREHCELVPYWYMEPDKDSNAVSIERIVPMYPFSKDGAQYERLIKILSLYRITLGQARQEELVEGIFNNLDEEKLERIHELFINLSPYYKKYSME